MWCPCLNWSCYLLCHLLTMIFTSLKRPFHLWQNSQFGLGSEYFENFDFLSVYFLRKYHRALYQQLIISDQDVTHVLVSSVQGRRLPPEGKAEGGLRSYLFALKRKWECFSYFTLVGNTPWKERESSMESYPIQSSCTGEFQSVLVKTRNIWVIFENQVDYTWNCTPRT